MTPLSPLPRAVGETGETMYSYPATRVGTDHYRKIGVVSFSVLTRGTAGILTKIRTVCFIYEAELGKRRQRGKSTYCSIGYILQDDKRDAGESSPVRNMYLLLYDGFCHSSLKMLPMPARVFTFCVSLLCICFPAAYCM